MTVTRKFIEIFNGQLEEGGVTPHRSVSGYTAAYLSFSGSDDLRVEIEGALGDSPDNYEPKSQEWTVIQSATRLGFHVLRTIPTLIRLRVTKGTLNRAAANLYPDANLLPTPVTGLSASETEGLVNEQIGGVLEDIAEATASTLKIKTAIGNSAISQLSTRTQNDGPQFVDGSRWLWKAAPSPLRQSVAAAGGGVWEREAEHISVKMFGAKGDGGDDTQALLDAIAFAKAKVAGTQILAVIDIPVGYYRYTQTLIQDFRCVIRGEYGMGNAVTLLYDPPQSVVDACVAGTTDPMSVPAILATGTRTGGTTHATLANGLKNGGEASLLYGCTIEGIQLSTTEANYGKLDGLVLRDVSEYDYQHMNINGSFRNGVVYWGANLVYATRCNVSNNKTSFVTRPANATNWQVSAVVAFHHHMNIWNSETNWELNGFVRHLHVTDSWQEWSKNHVLIQPAASSGAQIITDVVFRGVQFVSKTAEAGAFDERALRIDLSALTTQRVQIAGLAFNDCWGFFPNSAEIISLTRGTAMDVRVEPITLNNTEWYGLFVAQYLVHAEDMLPFNESWKLRIVGGVVVRKHWDSPIDPVTSLTSNINAMLLGWRWTTGEGHSITTTADGYMTMRGTATLNFGGQASVMEGTISHPRITSPQVTGLCLRGEPTMTAKAGAWYTKTLHLTSLFHALSQFTLAAYSDGEFAAGNSVTASFEVSGVLA